MGKPVTPGYKVTSVTSFRTGTAVVVKRSVKPTTPHGMTYEEVTFLDKNNNGRLDRKDVVLTAVNKRQCPKGSRLGKTFVRGRGSCIRNVTRRDISSFGMLVSRLFRQAKGDRKIIRTNRPRVVVKPQRRGNCYVKTGRLSYVSYPRKFNPPLSVTTRRSPVAKRYSTQQLLNSATVTVDPSRCHYATVYKKSGITDMFLAMGDHVGPSVLFTLSNLGFKNDPNFVDVSFKVGSTYYHYIDLNR